MILGGDLGGTKTLLALADLVDGRPKVVRQQRYDSAAYAALDDMLADFLADSPAITSAAFGVAGPVDGQRAKLTYLPWQLDAEALARRFALGRVALLNDFEAAAHGLSQLQPADLLTLHRGQPVIDAPRAIVGPGTGLGVAGLLPTPGGWQVVPGEGGHAGFAPQTAEQGELWKYLLDQNGRVTAEDVLSGPGISRIFAFFSGRPSEPAAIADAALLRQDPHAIATLRLWQECLGAFAGDLALQWLARGGVHLGGGVAAKLLPRLDTAPLVAAFLAKREHQSLVAAMPLQVVLAEDLGLRGALARASLS